MTSSNIPEPPDQHSIALLDADILVYRIGFASQNDEEKYCLSRVTEFVTDTVFFELNCESYEAWITGSNNFRNELAITAPYKGNRKATKPVHYEAIRQHLQKLGAVKTEGIEADDAIAIRATELKDKCWIVSIDKDLDQVSGWHYNFVTRQKYYISEEEGIQKFYRQILTGDRIDNIIGVRGIGPVKATRILSECKTEQELYDACLKQFEGNHERVIENARLLYLRRFEGEIWQPPHERERQ